MKKKEKVYHVGILSEVEAFTAIADGFKAKMTELGAGAYIKKPYNFEKIGRAVRDELDKQ
ncbi:MAG: hypothetical protein PVG39_17075 [Desulfobacteraceae bacterium]